ncbi:hypothetical protein [Sutterella sp.]|uniref:hypothetical protein n=1 Tax=Sutterella sp. TaxID=1981025 RepID=UPI0026E08C8D|nr:hypothetical protein [Sutterella sp.]MDO5530845.1 hypothetical protein [Sutterella sp.]
MRSIFTVGAAVSAALLTASAAQASVWTEIIDTTPAGLVKSSADRPGDWASFWSDTVEGARMIMENGKTTLVIPTYTNHVAWDWEDRAEENGWPMGMGLAREVIDDRGNERLLFLINFVDSNYRPEPMVGYQWVARWPLGASGLHVGAGYLVGITARGDSSWIPVAGPLPVAKIGTDSVSFYGTFIPISNVLFFYTTITTDDSESRKMPLPASSPWVKSPTLLYGSSGGQYVDNGEEYSPSKIGNGPVWGVGLRHYSGRNWQTDVKYSRSKHNIDRSVRGGTEGVRFETWSLTVAYNLDMTSRFRLFGGAGFGWSEAKSLTGSDSSVHPTTTLGFTWAVLDNLFITGSMDTHWARFKGVTPDRGSGYTLRSMPTSFTIGLGLAF